jgi:hypothetical protein
MWTPGRVAAAFATANGNPNKIQNNCLRVDGKVILHFILKVQINLKTQGHANLRDG